MYFINEFQTYSKLVDCRILNSGGIKKNILFYNNRLIFKLFAVYLLIYLLSVACLKLLFIIGVDKY